MIKNNIGKKVERIDRSLKLIKKASDKEATVEQSVITTVIEDLTYVIDQLSQVLLTFTSLLSKGKRKINLESNAIERLINYESISNLLRVSSA